jgi:hypothetical protein
VSLLRANQLALVFAVLMASAATAPAQDVSEFAGTWVLRIDGQNILKLTLAKKGNAVGGALTKPANLTIDQDGNVSASARLTSQSPCRRRYCVRANWNSPLTAIAST